jgi:hypothetical protein
MQLAATTGGTSVFCRSRAEVGQAITATLNRVASHYSVSLTMPDRPAKVMQVQIQNGGRALSYRSRYVVEKE